MINFKKLPIYIGESRSNGVSPSQSKVKFRLSLKDGSERLILTPWDSFYLLNNPYNLISLARLNNSRIFYSNEDENFYHVKTCRVLVQAL